jgi:glycosyltransferase involved in cell wall biosynthesis
MPSQPLLYGGLRVTNFHDLNLLKIRNENRARFESFVKRIVGGQVLAAAATRSDGLIVPSDATRMDVVRFAGRPASECTLIYYAAEVESAEMARVDIAFDEFILYVGSQLPYKNIMRLAEAHQLLREKFPGLGLVLAGRMDGPARTVQSEIEARRYEGIVFTGLVSDEQRDWLYAHCSVYAFPSLLEGFGLPGLEAMLRGAPVASSNSTSLPEIYGNAAVYFDPLDVVDIARAVGSILASPELADHLRSRGRDRVRLFSWERATRETLEIYRAVLRGEPAGPGEEVLSA